MMSMFIKQKFDTLEVFELEGDSQRCSLKWSYALEKRPLSTSSHYGEKARLTSSNQKHQKNIEYTVLNTV